jgi:hypothetical protein
MKVYLAYSENENGTVLVFLQKDDKGSAKKVAMKGY